MSASRIFKRNFAVKSVKKCYLDKVSYKAAPGIDRINKVSFESRLDEYIQKISLKVHNGSYKFIPYKEKLISKGAGKPPRQISVPSIRDKITLSLLNDSLSEIFEADVNRKIVQTLVDELKTSINTGKYDYFIKLDIKEFFPSIRHEILMKSIKKKIRQKELLSLIEKALTTATIPFPTKEYEKNNRGIPQGIAIASVLANIYLSNIDKDYLRENDEFKYFRYVDDILILCRKNNYLALKNNLISRLSEIGLEVSPTKTKFGLCEEGFSYLGYYYKTIKNFAGFSVKTESIKKFEESIIKIFSEYKFQNNTMTEKFIWKLNKKITGCIFEKRKYGWVFFYSQIDDMNLLYHLDWFVQKLCRQMKVDTNVRKRIKRFVRTFHEVKYNLSNTQYIPNFDNVDLKEKRKILREVFDVRDVRNLTKDEVEVRFKKNVFRFIKELERDIQTIS